MPAAAVIPAPIAYAKVVAVKKLVVGIQPMPTALCRFHAMRCRSARLSSGAAFYPSLGGVVLGAFTLKKLECFKQASALNMIAWNNKIRHWSYFVGFHHQCNN